MLLYGYIYITMATYNIIYTSPAEDTYLWNGTGFDKLDNADREVLFYSGRSIKNEEQEEALKKSKAAAQQLFPTDADPKIKSVAVKVSN
jgi:hypothetical protein